MKARRKGYSPPIVMSIHGIRTRGEWQKDFASVASAVGVRTEAFDYGRYGLLRFLTPPFNNWLVDRFYQWYGGVVSGCKTVDLDQYQRRPSIVAHSLGSWVVGNAMLKYPDVRFDKIILAGSILPREFDWSTLFARDQVAFVRNEFGQRDPWPVAAKYVVLRAGTGGSQGFGWFSSLVDDVRFEWFGHSNALMRQHISTHWLPVLQRAPSPLSLLNGRDIADGDQFEEHLTHTGTVIDAEAYAKIAHYKDVEFAPGLSESWARMNPDIYTFLIDRQRKLPAGYINAMPVSDDVYEELKCGRIVDNEITDEGVLPYVGRKSVKVYFMSIAVANEHRRWGDGFLQHAFVRLLAGLEDKLIFYAKNHGTRVSHFLASAWTPEGLRLSELFGMKRIGQNRFGDAIFELEIDALEKARPSRRHPLRKLLEVYEGLS